MPAPEACQKRIIDANTAQYRAVLKVITVEQLRARQTCRVNDHRIPEGDSIQSMQVDDRYHITFHKADHSGMREQLNPLLRRFRIDAQFPGCRGKVFLQNLN